MDEQKIPKNNGLNFGLQVSEEVGGLPVDIYQFSKLLNGSKDWMFFSSEREIQKTNFIDIMDCVIESVINIYHIFMDLLNGWGAPLGGSPIFPTQNLSQRFNAKMSGVTPSGNTTERADNSMENDGVCDESFWHRTPDMTWAQYYATIPENVRQQAKLSVKIWQYKAYVITPSHQIMMDALDRGLLAVTGYAWAKGDDGLYHDFGYAPNHRFVVAGYVKGVKWIVRDSYPTDFLIDNNSTEQEFVKELSWDFSFGECKLIIISPVVDKTNSLIALFYKIRSFFLNINNKFMAWKNFISTKTPDGKSLLSYFLKLDENKNPTKQLIDINDQKTFNQAILTLLRENGYATPMDYSDVMKIPDRKWF